jgi:hypothetical protein
LGRGFFLGDAGDAFCFTCCLHYSPCIIAGMSVEFYAHTSCVRREREFPYLHWPGCRLHGKVNTNNTTQTQCVISYQPFCS